MKEPKLKQSNVNSAWPMGSYRVVISRVISRDITCSYVLGGIYDSTLPMNLQASPSEEKQLKLDEEWKLRKAPVVQGSQRFQYPFNYGSYPEVIIG